nr:hypothetical protein [Tanacetum cinerariifolium]
TMADVNVNAPADQAPTMAPPTRIDDQIMPHIRWILWGVVNRAHIDYAERIWEEFTQSIHTFIEDKKNLAHHTHGKKKATLIVILSIWFTKLIIYHLQRKHKFYPRLDYLLHMPNEEPVLGYLKFNAKRTKREVFGMPIPGNLITANIQGKPYYQEYLAKVAKHQRYLAGEQGSDPDSPALKPTKATKESKPSAPKANLRPPVTKSASSQQPEPKPAPAKSQGKKRKLRALEESLKSIYDAPRGSLASVVIRELASRKYQPLLEVQGKGKEKVTDEQVSRDLLTLQTPKKKSLVDQYIFQRHTSTPTGSSGHDESSSLYVELGLTDSEVESDEDVLGIDARVQGQAGPNPSDAASSQPLPLVVHAGPNLEYMDLEVTDVSTQPHPEQMMNGLLQRLTRRPQLGDLFFNDKPSEANNETTTAETEAESMVSVTIQLDTSAIPPMKTSIINLTPRPESHNVHRPLQATATKTTTTTTIHPPPSQPQQSTKDSMLMKRISELEHIMANLIQENKHLEERLDTLEKSMNRDHSEELLKDLAEAHKKKKKRRDSPKTPPGSPPHQPPPPSPPAGTSGASGSPGASGSSQVLPPPPPPPSTNHEAWTTTDTRLRLYVSSTPEDLQMDDEMAPDAQAQSFDDEDIKNTNIPKVNLWQDWWKPLEEDIPTSPEPAWSISSSDVPVPKKNWASALGSTYLPPPENSLLAQTGDMEMFMDWFCKRQGITELKPQDLEGPAFELVKVFHPNVIHLQYQMEECHKLLTDSMDDSIIKHNVSKPLPLGGPPGQPYYPDVGLEQMVPDHMWIDEECKYDIAAIAVRTHIRILSVFRIKVFSMYEYDYMKKIVLRRADLNEHIITERDFKYLYPSDFEDLYLLNLQGHLNHLPPKDKKILTTAVNLSIRHLVIRQRVKDFQLGIESYQTQLNLTKPRWDATGFEYKHDYTVIDSPRAVTFRDRYGVQMIMRFNEIYKFSDGTLHQIDEVLDYRVKEFKVNMMNPGLNISFWTRKDVDRSKEFMFAIQKWLKTRRIFRNLESFVGG